MINGRKDNYMGEIALLVSREEMLYQAHNLLQEKPYDIGIMRVIKTEEAVSQARQSVAQGASIIIARGLQASLIKQYTDIPVAELVITAQEMALLVIRAKQILKKSNPVIGVVGFENMFCNMSYFDTIYEIELRTYFAQKGSELEMVVGQAVEDELDLIIGGDTAVGAAGNAGIPSLFLSITEDSMRNAFDMAERMSFAMGAEKRNAAQMETLLDYSFNGITRMDANGVITDINPIMEDILGRKKEEVRGLLVGQVYRELDQESLRQVLKDGKESYSFLMRINGTSIFAIVAPVTIDNRVDGAILTCHRMKKRQTVEEETKRKRHSQGLIALGEFDDIIQDSKAMQDCIHLTKLYALSEKPVLIFGEAGTEKRLLAQSIHNAGSRRGKPFIDISCDGIAEAEQLEMVFGDKGAAARVEGGSMLIEDIDCLTRSNQYRLYQLIRYRLRMGQAVMQSPNLDIRVMVTAREPLIKLVNQGKFREDLYYLLEGLTVRIPPLRERREDLKIKIEAGIREASEHYSRYHILTQGAMKLLLEYPWEGNLFQVESYCERLILTATKRSLDEIVIRRVLDELYPCRNSDTSDEEGQEEGLGDISAVQITRTLRQMRGNREKTAKELGISKATLWRRMKKYGIQ
ncbi:MAG: PrpR N-terminal domain-containing protein [Lachnospiraceae bacterium]